MIDYDDYTMGFVFPQQSQQKKHSFFDFWGIHFPANGPLFFLINKQIS